MKGWLVVAVALMACPALQVSGNASDSVSTGTWPSGQTARDYIESYVMTHPFRTPLFPPFREAAQNDLASLLTGLGLTVERHDFGRGVNIVGIQHGTTSPDQWVVLSAHYDSLDVGFGSTIFGAWDNGAGISALLAMAEAFQNWQFPFTVAYVFFDLEEISLGGSARFVQDYAAKANVDLVANINTDPPGLNWPCGDPGTPFHVKVVHDEDLIAQGDPRSLWLHDAVEDALDDTAVPEPVIDRTQTIHLATVGGLGPIGTSDHVNFGRRGIANVYLGGTPTYHVGGEPGQQMVSVITYPIHTPLDTLEVLEARCLEGSLVGGLQTILDVMTNTLIHLGSGAIPAAPGGIPDVPEDECLTWTYPGSAPVLPQLSINPGQLGEMVRHVGEIGQDLTCQLVAVPGARDAADRLLYGSVRTLPTTYN